MDKSQDVTPVPGEDHIRAKLKETQVLFRQQKYSEAKRILHEILKEDPNNAAAYNNLGSIYLIRGRFTRAEKYFRKAVELNPELKDARENLTTIDKMRKGRSRADVDREISALGEEAKKLVQEKKVEDAIEKFKQILDLDSTNVKVYNNLGILHFQMNDHEEAEKYFVKALELYFLHGLAFDDQYTTIRDNLNKLRKKIGSNVSDYMKTSFTTEIENGLTSGEEVLKTFMGMMSIPYADRVYEVNTMLNLTNKRLIIYYKSSSLNEGEPVWKDFPHVQILDARMVKGILKNTLTIITPESEFKVSSSHRKEMKAFLAIIKSLLKKKEPGEPAGAPAKAAPASVQETSFEKQPPLGIPDVETKIIIRMLESLRDYKVLTDMEFDSKIKMIMAGRKAKSPMAPASPFKRSGGLMKDR